MMMAILLLLLCFVVAVLAVWGISWLFPSWHAARHGLHDDQDPIERLALRYLRGEITPDEYHSIRHALRENGDRWETHRLSQPPMARSGDPNTDESHDP